jgi:hypothetical protein
MCKRSQSQSSRRTAAITSLEAGRGFGCQLAARGLRGDSAVGGKFANCTVSGDCDAVNVTDGNGVSVRSYLVKGACYDVSCFTGRSSKVCAPAAAGSGRLPPAIGIAANPASHSSANVVLPPGSF